VSLQGQQPITQDLRPTVTKVMCLELKLDYKNYSVPDQKLLSI